jgi:Bifunctional DNA primase/polymerase, N-terminal
LPVLPLRPRTKQPRFDGGYKIATCHQKLIAEHWHRHPADNIGIRPNRGVVVRPTAAQGSEAELLGPATTVKPSPGPAVAVLLGDRLMLREVGDHS